MVCVRQGAVPRQCPRVRRSPNATKGEGMLEEKNMLKVLDEAIRAWKAYEGGIDWDLCEDGDVYPDMDSRELDDVMDAVDDLDDAIFREEENPGSTFPDIVPEADREILLDLGTKALAAFKAFLYGVDDPAADNRYEPCARKVSEVLGIPFAGRHGGGSTNHWL